jgi:hypothetical protein
MFVNQNLPKTCSKFYCEICDYGTCKKSSYSEHILTRKHVKSTFVNQNQPKTCSYHICENCNKKYKDKSGLWRHKQKCVNNNENNKPIDQSSKEPSDKEIILLLIKENNELKNMMMKVIENGTNNIIHTNSHNKAFNLNFFLNETCKNAMNITDFIDSIKLQLSDFMDVGEVGFIEGISNIIVKNLNNMDETERPIHCTDKKREIFYIKDQDKWEKEEEDKKKLKKMIKNVAFKNEKLMKIYKDTYPDYNDPNSKRSDQYSKTVIEAMDNKEESREKIIRNISKATTIKQNLPL